MAGEQVAGTVVNANGAPTAPVAPLGDAGKTAAAPPVGAVTEKPTTPGSAPVSRDTIASDPAAVSAAEKAVADAKSPEEKAKAEAALAKLKPALGADAAKAAADKAAADAAKAAAITAAEKAVADAKTPEEKAKAEAALKLLKDGPSPNGAPETYADFKLPDGLPVDKAALTEFGTLAKALNLSQDGAQKLIDFDAARLQAAAANAAKNHVTAWNKLMGDRLSAAKADPEVGGSGNPDVFARTVAEAREGIKAFGTPALQAYLNTSEAGSHVEVIRAFSAAGRAIKNDSLHLGGAVLKDEAPSLADRLFPKTAAKK